MNGVLPWLVRWAIRVGTRVFCPTLAALVGPVDDIFFFIVHYFNSFVPVAQQAGQAIVQGRLSLKVCLGFYLRYFRGCSFFLAASKIARCCEKCMSFHLVSASYLFVRCHSEFFVFLVSTIQKRVWITVIDPVLPRQIHINFAHSRNDRGKWICVAAFAHRERNKVDDMKYFSDFLHVSALLYLYQLNFAKRKHSSGLDTQHSKNINDLCKKTLGV
jgi:hypothetical protein